MDIRKKLVELLKKTEINKINGHAALAETCFTPKVFENMATNLIAHGVTVLPCKVGDAVWGIKKYNRGYAVKQGVAYQMYFGENMRLCICVKNVCRGEWGANVFATKKEAEQALLTLPKGE